MSTKREIIYTVFERLNISSDDTDISEEFVAHLIDTNRAKLIRQLYGSKTWDMPIEIKQELCLGLENVQNIDGQDCFGTILRTKDIIPKGISVRGVDGAVLSIRTYDRKELYINIVPIERLPFIDQDPYTRSMVYAAIDTDRRVYFLSGNKKFSMLEAIKINGIYEDVDAAYALGCQELTTSISKEFYGKPTLPYPVEEVCEPWDREYPMEGSMQDNLVDMIVKVLTRTMALPEDEFNDAEDVRGK